MNNFFFFSHKQQWVCLSRVETEPNTLPGFMLFAPLFMFKVEMNDDEPDRWMDGSKDECTHFRGSAMC